jgi:hypothetical protein
MRCRVREDCLHLFDRQPKVSASFTPRCFNPRKPVSKRLPRRDVPGFIVLAFVAAFDAVVNIEV